MACATKFGPLDRKNPRIVNATVKVVGGGLIEVTRNKVLRGARSGYAEHEQQNIWLNNREAVLIGAELLLNVSASTWTALLGTEDAGELLRICAKMKRKMQDSSSPTNGR